MIRTIVVKFCNCAMALLDHVRSDMTDRAYWFFWRVWFYAMGYSDDETVQKPCWYCLVGAQDPNDPEDVSCEYCLSGELNPEAERYWLNADSFGFCWHCQVGADHPDDGVPIKGCLRGPLADSLGTAPEKLDNGKCGCDRPRWEIRPCGHCACASECDDCPANKLWRDEQESWCGCAEPGKVVLDCGHCGCRNGLCLEFVNAGPNQSFEKRRKAGCA